ncbi:MAG TPA: outer membrane lipoprotein-sorting protein [Nevskiales bacterium]|nr:outer membrane lipoprotein-sorting protein [Nevskiales bacterium]
MKHLFLPLCLVLAAGPAPAATADAVIAKLEARYLGWKDLCTQMQLKNIGKSGSVQEGGSKLCVLFGPDGSRYGRVTVTSPAVARGMDLITKADLVGQTRGGQSQQWLYMPASRRATLINANNTESPFLGSEFSFADLDLAYLDPAKLKRLDEAECGGERCLRYAVGGANVLQIARVVWVAIPSGAVKRIEVQKQGKPYKQLEVLNETRHPSGWWVADRVVMRNLQTGHRTEAVWQDIRFNSGLTPADFDPKKLYGPAPGGRPQ